MKPQIHRIIKLTETQLILKLHTSALMYSIYADTTLLFIFSKGKESPYGTYEATFYQYNFMHLAGIKSQTMSAQKFYEACLNGTIKIEDCSPTHSLNNMYEKISVINNLLDFKHSKCYRIGEKNLITKDNDFELATGNSSGVIGYDHRISQKGSKKLNRNINAMPTTLLATPITRLVSNPEKIIFILQKPIQEKRYQKILYEIKKGLLRENYSLLPRNIQNSICCYNSEF